LPNRFYLQFLATGNDVQDLEAALEKYYAKYRAAKEAKNQWREVRDLYMEIFLTKQHEPSSHASLWSPKTTYCGLLSMA